ncbi:hypothetical protein [Actinoplanes sp. NPDC051851]|uniref:hypothetical protein n=1 Tax=Actinoplanes sp. NPDC051851 TaxID=3154753 RepID=UPI00343D7C10
MHTGGITRRHLVAGALALALAACTPAAGQEPSAAPSPPPRYFGLDHYGNLTLMMSEQEALATGDLQPTPVATLLGRNVYSFTGGPTPDASRMAADTKIEKDVAEAESGAFGDSSQGTADAARVYAASASRVAARMLEFQSSGGASYLDGALDTIAAPPGAVTEAGIHRGSTLTEVQTAYAAKGLTQTSATLYEVPVPGRAGWVLLLTFGKDTVTYMSLGKAG